MNSNKIESHNVHCWLAETMSNPFELIGFPTGNYKSVLLPLHALSGHVVLSPPPSSLSPSLSFSPFLHSGDISWNTDRRLLQNVQWKQEQRIEKNPTKNKEYKKNLNRIGVLVVYSGRSKKGVTEFFFSFFFFFQKNDL